MDFLVESINIYSVFMLLYFLLINIFYVTLIVISFKRLRKFVEIINTDITDVSSYTTPISLIVPAYNEQETIIENIKSLLKLSYPQFEVVIVNDGSTDNTLKKIIEHFNLRKIDAEVNLQVECKEIRALYSSFALPNLVVVDKENGGKSDALNSGINVSRYPLYCSVDADSIIEKDALLRLAKPFLEHDETIAVGGIVRIVNGCVVRDGKLVQAKLPKESLVKFQIVEYFRAFLTSRVGWEDINSLLIISGAFGLFKKAAVIRIGGYQNTIGEDMELTLRMHRYFRENRIRYKIGFASDAVCWTQVPNSVDGLRSQRMRWHRGLIDSLSKHQKLLFNRNYGRIGLAAVPYFWFVEMIGPLVEFVGYFAILLSMAIGMTTSFFIYVFLLAYFYGIMFSLSAILFEEFSYKRYRGIKDISVLIFYVVIEQFVYRQLTVLWRTRAFFNFRKGSKQWGMIERKAFTGGI